MKAISILYHDVVNDDRWDESGFPGSDARPYKLEVGEFDRQLTAMSRILPRRPDTVFGLKENGNDPPSVLLTFDDGGASAYPVVAELLERHGWIAHFFVTAGYVGKKGFVSKEHIRELRKMGHVIGSHSFTHPPRISTCSSEQIFQEWDNSIKFLSDVLGESVVAASVPAGRYSTRVAKAAACAHIEALFTSEPTVRCCTVDGCLILGRYTVWKQMDSQDVVGIAAGRLLPRWKQWMWWNTKKLLKSLGGDSYLRARRALLRRSSIDSRP